MMRSMVIFACAVVLNKYAVLASVLLGGGLDFKDDAKEVNEGFECGVTLAKFGDVKEGDVYEAFKMEEYRD